MLPFSVNLPTRLHEDPIIDCIRNSYKEAPLTNIREDAEKDINAFFDEDNHHKKQPTDWSAKPHELIEKQEFQNVLHNCMENLPKPANDAFHLREIENLKSKEICNILNITKANFWVLLHRARLRLRKCLEINWFD